MNSPNPVHDPAMPRVFISHATADRAVVEREIISLLRRHGIEHWYSPIDIGTAEEFERSILGALRDCGWFLIALSPRAAESEWVRSELHWALSNRKGKVVPVLIEDCPLEEFDIRLPRIQCVDFRSPDDECRARLLRAWGVAPISTLPDSPTSSAPRFESRGRATSIAPPPLLIAPFDAAAARRGQEQWADYLRQTSDLHAQVEITNSIGMRLTLIPPGEYLRGSPQSDRNANANEKPAQRVRITHPFYLGTVTITQENWFTVMATQPWRHMPRTRDGGEYPATYVSWDDAVLFCEELTFKDGRTYRLPTEAEWEYACRAGTTTRYWFSDDPARLGDYAWFNGNTGGRRNALKQMKWENVEHWFRAHPVGLKQANPFGLCDMHGNVWEWCQDGWNETEYAAHRGRIVDDPDVPSEGASHRVSRGGCWQRSPRYCRSAFRNWLTPGTRLHDLGFRVLAVPSAK